MLEILLLIGLCKGMGALMHSKGRSALALQIFTVVGWIGGEVGGAILGAVQHQMQHPGEEPGLQVYLYALIGAVIGAGIPFIIAFMIPSKQPEQLYPAQGSYPSRPIDPNNPYAS